MVDEVLVPGKIDEFDIYAMLYKVEKGADISLDGSTMNRESEYCVALADVEDKTEKGEYTKFSVPFLYREKVDYTRYDYKLAIILASSARGAHYEGAIGSMLTVDELKLIFEDWENDEKN